MIEHIKQYNIYKNKELSDFIISLESKYTIVDEVSFFKKLVSFSENKNYPFHRWFKYKEGFSNHLVRELIHRSGISKDEYVIDPFSGSGTTVIESKMNGFDALGVDINPMSSFIANTKVQNYKEEDYQLLIDYIELFKNAFIKHTDTNIEDYQDMLRFFDENHLKSLLFIKEFYEGIKVEKIQALFKLGYLSIIEECSNRKKDGSGLRNRPTKVKCVIEHYRKKMDDISDDILELSHNEDIKLNNEIVLGNAMYFNDYVEEFNKKYNKKPGVIIFSPPYANTFDYFEIYKLELRLGGYVNAVGELKQFRNNAIRSFTSFSNKEYHTNKYVNLLAKEIEEANIVNEEIKGKRDSWIRKIPSMILGYFTDMETVISECAKSLDSGKKCYINVDQNSYLGRIVPSDLFLAHIAEQHGFKVNEIIKCRIARTSPQQLNAYPYLAECLRESIIVLEKE